MAILTKGTDFTTGDQVTAVKLDNLVDNATFASGAVDNTTTQIDGSGQIIVKDAGIGTAKITDDAVTAAKIAAGAVTDVVYPVGSIFTTVTNYADSAAVVSAIGGTTWTAFGAGRVLVGLDSSDTDFDTVEETGGAKEVTLSTSQIPAHTHDTGVVGQNDKNFVAAQRITVASQKGFDDDNNDGTASSKTTSVGGGSAHTNVQPYIVVYMWKRTA